MPFDGDPANYVAAVPAESAANLLVSASRYLNLGWCKGSLGLRTGEVCALGALLAVTGGSEVHNYSPAAAVAQIRQNPHGNRALNALDRAASAHGHCSIEVMNDHRSSTKSLMVAVLMEAASLAMEDFPLAASAPAYA